MEIKLLVLLATVFAASTSFSADNLHGGGSSVPTLEALKKNWYNKQKASRVKRWLADDKYDAERNKFEHSLVDEDIAQRAKMKKARRDFELKIEQDVLSSGNFQIAMEELQKNSTKFEQTAKEETDAYFKSREEKIKSFYQAQEKARLLELYKDK